MGGGKVGFLEKLKKIMTPETNLGQKSYQEEEIASCLEDHIKEQVALLTPRENDLFILLLEGFTLKESANQLDIKYSTANTHITSIYKKLQVNSRAELIINYRMTSKLN